MRLPRAIARSIARSIARCWGSHALGGVLVASLAGPAHGAELGVYALDSAGAAVPLSQVKASLARTPPLTEEDAGDGLRLLLATRGPLPERVELTSFDERGRVVAELTSVTLSERPCPAGLTGRCAESATLRVVADEVDAEHPMVRGRSIGATLGGTIRIAADGSELGRVLVAGPQRTPIGAIDRYRARLRFVLVRLAPGGSLPVGGDRVGALSVVRSAVERANALWGACGISFGPPEDAVVEIVDPPPPHLVSVGCVHGLPASGGAVRLTVAGELVEVAIDQGMLPREAARRIAREIERAGFSARVSDNPRLAAGAHPTSDVLVRSRSGALLAVEPPPSGPVSTDATLDACIGSVELEDGLQHFGDVDASVGTIEERTLLKAYDDLDPATIDVYMVAGFGRGGRIGESFIAADRGSITNAVLLDRAGIRSNRASFTLAHEVGHVLLDEPGHPDDYGSDTPSLLMDSDASDPSAFGPRRLPVDDCVRALRESGPGAPIELLAPWPLRPPRAR